MPETDDANLELTPDLMACLDERGIKFLTYIKLFLRVYLMPVLASALLIAGCAPQSRATCTPIVGTPHQFSQQILGHSIQKRPIELHTAGTGSETILVLATIHGDEGAGTPLLHELLRVLKQSPKLLEGRTMLIVPVANPDGLALRTRTNAAGIDLNRNFPAANRVDTGACGRAGLTEPESKVLHDLILDRRPARILTLHQPLGCLDYDGPAAAVAARMRTYCNLPIRKLGVRPGSLGEFADEHDIPIITMELKRSDSLLTPVELWAEYGPAVLAFITWPSHVD